MTGLLFYRSNTEDEPAIRDFIRNVSSNNLTIEMMDVYTRDGATKAEIYDVTQYPSVLITQDDGKVVMSYIGIMPTISEANYYLRAL